MGKKKPQKTKEIAVAIAETSTSKLPDDGVLQSLLPRKRGRPRKILDEPQTQHHNKKLPPPPPPEVADEQPEKKPKTTGDEPPPDSIEEASIQGEKEEEPKSGDGSRSRGRRKNKPRKSS